MKKTLVFISFFLICFINTFVYADDTYYIDTPESLNYSIETNKTKTYIFNKPVDIEELNFNSSRSYINIRVYQEKNQIYSFTTNSEVYESSVKNLNNITKIVIKSGSSSSAFGSITFTNIEKSTNFVLEGKGYNEDTGKIYYTFKEKPSLADIEATFIDNYYRSYEYDIEVIDKTLYITPKNLKKGNTYKFTLEKVFCETDNTIYLTNCGEVAFFIEDDFKLLKTYITENYILKYNFNKSIQVTKSDVTVKNSKNEDIDFNIQTSDKTMIITFNSLEVDKYKVTINKVQTTDNKEQLTNIENIFEKKNNFYVISKDFGQFINPESTELNILFNKEFTINNVNLDSIEVQKDIKDKSLKIVLPELAKNDYVLKISATSVDNEKIELLYKFTVKEITSNKEVDNIVYPYITMFDNAKTRGLTIIITAITAGIIFIIAKWLWKKIKTWLKTI